MRSIYPEFARGTLKHRAIQRNEQMTHYNVDGLHSGLSNSRVLSLELYTLRRQKLTLLYLFTDLFCKEISLKL